MVYYTAAALLGLAVSASAGVHHNHAALHKKGVEHAPEPYGAAVKYVTPVPLATASPNATSCGCTTYTTTWYGPPTLGPGPPPPASNTSTSASYPSASVPSIPVTTYSVSTSEASAPTTPAAPETPKSPEMPPAAPQPYGPQSYGGSSNQGGGDVNHDGTDDSAYGVGTITPNGNQWAMTYTPYAENGGCQSADQVNQDIGSIKQKGFTTVRIYATDCSGLINVGNACKQHGMKLIAGIFIDASGLGKAHEQLNDIANWGKQGNWNLVEMVVAGNEAVFQGAVSASDLAGFMGDVKSTLKSAGYSGPVTTTEPLNIIQANAGTLCPAMDVVAANIHPFFNGGFAASEAGDFVASQMADLEKACGGNKPAYNLETGWPSGGQPNGKAVPGVAEQKAAIDSIVAKVGSKSAIFSFSNDKWKAPGQYGVEQNFGCSSLFS
ncbi:putative beta-glucosidase btgE [Pseudocercospora fuligena]|uniref:Probable beta-glucosidase btgE n=1 Tax=Pseudocercospora fuligena TaxID=685502 RepID=A0A8H6RNV5_9PEZI|nr:putative beta-glucosidase btgE [Pseudocercospora fuligena]